MRSARLATSFVVLAGVLSGCGIRPAASVDASGAYAIRSDRMNTQDFATADFTNAVYERMAAGRSAFGNATAGLPAETFKALDADGDGQVTRTEWNRPVAPEAAQAYAGAYRPLAAAAFRLAGNGRAILSYSDLDRSVGKHPDRPDTLTLRSFQASAPGGSMDVKRFEGFYPALSGQGMQPKGLGNLLLGPYLKFAGFAGSEFLMRRPRKAITTRPDKLGYRYEEATLTSDDGLAIKAWYIPARTPTTKAVVMIHGHGSNRATWVENPTELKAIHEAGYNVVTLDLRRHGESGGEWITMALHEHRDVRAGVRWAAVKGNTAIGVLGNSLGGASSIHAAAITSEVKAVWDDCAFASIDLAVGSAAKMLNVPYQNLVIPAVLETARRRLGEDLAGGNPKDWIEKFGGKPVYIVHGGSDPYINAESSHVNWAHAKDPKSLWIVPGAGHGNSSSTQPAEYQKRLVAFFNQYIGSGALPGFGVR